MKHLITLVAACALAAVSAQAQDAVVYSPQTVTHATVTGVGPSTSSNFVSVVLDVRKQKEVMLQYSYKLSDAGTDATTLTYGFSVDGTAPTAYHYTMLATNTGTTTVVQPENISVNGAGYLHLISIANGDATGNLTNLVIKYAIKKGAE